MSRLTISNIQQLKDLATLAMATASKTGQRALITLDSAPAGWSQLFANTYGLRYVSSKGSNAEIATARLTGTQAGAGAGAGADRADRISAVLGSQNNLVVFATGPQLDAGLLAAAAGTVCTGGLLILDLGRMSRQSSADSSDLSAVEVNLHSASGNFNQRLRRLIQRESSNQPSLSRVVCVDSDSGSDSKSNSRSNTRPDAGSDAGLDSHEKTQSPEIPKNKKPWPPSSALAPQPQAMSEQTRLLEQATNHLTAHSSGCLLISGRRGRGKSMLLVRIANWLVANQIDFSVTSNHQSALHTFRQHFNGHCDPIISHEKALQTTGNVLLLDEASNMSVKQLHVFQANYQHLVLSSTTEGYENAGRAFVVRFAEYLITLDKAMLQLRPELPWRWQPADNLEQIIDELLLSNQTTRDMQLEKRLNALTHQSSLTPQCRRVERAQLAADEGLLHEIHTLLSNNHYQYSVKDLQHLLDSPSLQVWVQQIEDTVVGCLVLEIEGNIDPELHVAIINGKRRLPHHLLPQLLALKALKGDVLGKRFARVVRIAVIPEFRRNRYASLMLKHVEEYLQQGSQATSAMGASFANDVSSLAFWHSNGYTQFNAGKKINPRTGTTSTAVIKTWDTKVEDAVIKAILNQP